MEYWEFLIQREGDRGWRTIKTGNLQLLAGKYRIVANSDEVATQIQIRVTHQTPGSTSLSVPKQRSQSRIQTTNQRGLVAILPFTELRSGIWQFVCSGTTADQVAWQRILKLRVLPRTPHQDAVNIGQSSTELLPTLGSVSATSKPPAIYTSPILPTAEDRFTLPTPTKPVVPISMVGEQENWADGLDRLLEQLERESLEPQPPKAIALTQTSTQIQLRQIFDSPSQLINLNRSTFTGVIPGSRLTISGTCNLDRLEGKLIKAAKIAKLSICLRHPHTAEIIGSIEQSLPLNLDKFTFSGDLDLPTEPQISFLIGEVNLYDKHYIQLGSDGFTVTLSSDALNDVEISLFQLAEDPTDSTAELLAQLTEELKLETVTLKTVALKTVTASANRSILPESSAIMRGHNHSELNQPAVLPATNQAAFTYPGIVPVNPASHEPAPTVDITGDLEIDFALASFGSTTNPSDYHYDYEGIISNLEIVLDD
jgi:hypothetical protein